MFPRLASFLILGLCSSGAFAADATYRPSFHPDQLKGPPAGRPNEVLVLGTPLVRPAQVLPDRLA